MVIKKQSGATERNKNDLRSLCLKDIHSSHDFVRKSIDKNEDTDFCSKIIDDINV